MQMMEKTVNDCVRRGYISACAVTGSPSSHLACSAKDNHLVDKLVVVFLLIHSNSLEDKVSLGPA